MLDRRVTPRVQSSAAVCAAMLPIVVAMARAVVTDWVPIGDSAYFTLRSFDVGTRRHPLVGAWSSGSVSVDEHVNNLGALQIYLLAPFVRVSSAAGTAVGVAVVQLAAVVAIAWLASRLGGHRMVLATMTAVSLMTWVMGSEMLITPQQHQYLLLPYLVVLMSAWAAVAGDRWAIVPFVAAASLATQTHLSYPVLVAALAPAVIAGHVLAARSDPDRSRWRRPWLVASGLGAVLWVPPLIDQLFGWGNLRAVVSAPGDAGGAGIGTGLRIVADVLMGRAGYVRPGYAIYNPNVRLGTSLQVTLLLLVWIGLGVAAIVLARRTGRTRTTAWFAVAWAALLGAIVDAALLPETIFGLVFFNYRWLWPTAAFLVLGALQLVIGFDRRLGRPFGTAAVALVLVALSVANLPESVATLDPDQHREWRRVVAEMQSQLADVELDGPVVIDQSNLLFGHPYAYPVGVALRERGIEYRYEAEEQERRFGADRVADGTEPTRLVLFQGDNAVARFNDPRLIVSVGGVFPLIILMESG